MRGRLRGMGYTEMRVRVGERVEEVEATVFFVLTWATNRLTVIWGR